MNGCCWIDHRPLYKVHLLLCTHPNDQSQGSSFKHLDMLKITFWSSNQASDLGRKVTDVSLRISGSADGRFFQVIIVRWSFMRLSIESVNPLGRNFVVLQRRLEKHSLVWGVCFCYGVRIWCKHESMNPSWFIPRAQGDSGVKGVQSRTSKVWLMKVSVLISWWKTPDAHWLRVFYLSCAFINQLIPKFNCHLSIRKFLSRLSAKWSQSPHSCTHKPGWGTAALTVSVVFSWYPSHT